VLDAFCCACHTTLKEKVHCMRNTFRLHATPPTEACPDTRSTLSGQRDDDGGVAASRVGAGSLAATGHPRYNSGRREADYGRATLTSSKTAVATAAESWLVTTRLLLDGDIDSVTVDKVTQVTPSLDVWPV